MPPISAGVSQLAEDLIKDNRVMIFGKSYCPYCKKVKDLFASLNVEFKIYDLDIVENGAEIQAYLFEKTGQKTVPNVFVNQVHVGGSTDTQKLVTECRLQTLLAGDGDRFEYDLFVIGGGSGGLACSKEAARLGAKVAVADFVTPTPIGTKWGLGGTCVNVGCIPKKLMHQAALLGGAIGDSKHFGWQVPDKVQHDWNTMVTGIQDHIHGLNWGYKVQLRQKNVRYYNSLCKFVDKNTVILTDSKGKEETVTARTFVLAMGGRPYYPDIPGAKEYCITSDDIFSLPYNPGKTLFVGASYIALECAGFLHGLGNDVTVMVRSIFLRGFDQDMANKVAAYMDGHGVKFLKEFVPIKFEKIEEGSPGKILVTYQSTSGGDLLTEVFDSVCLAIGRTPQTGSIGLEKAGVQLNPKTGFVLSDDCDRTNVENIYGIGDVLDGKPELTPVAIQAGKLLARRLYSGSKEKCAYDFVPTTVFTPLEYGACGYSEEKAIETFGAENIEVYHTNFTPLEATVPHHPDNECYAKLIVNLADNDRVVGFHVLGPNAGEITQGFAIGFKLGATKSHFDDLIGIHPTNAEIFTTLDVTKRSGDSTLKTGC